MALLLPASFRRKNDIRIDLIQKTGKVLFSGTKYLKSRNLSITNLAQHLSCFDVYLLQALIFRSKCDIVYV